MVLVSGTTQNLQMVLSIFLSFFWNFEHIWKLLRIYRTFSGGSANLLFFPEYSRGMRSNPEGLFCGSSLLGYRFFAEQERFGAFLRNGLRFIVLESFGSLPTELYYLPKRQESFEVLLRNPREFPFGMRRTLLVSYILSETISSSMDDAKCFVYILRSHLLCRKYLNSSAQNVRNYPWFRKIYTEPLDDLRNYALFHRMYTDSFDVSRNL